MIFKNSFLLVVVAMCGMACSSKSGQAPGADHSPAQDDQTVILTQPQYEYAAIELGGAAPRVIGAELQVNGTISVPPQGNISINMPYGGFVKHTTMLPGTKVKKGQLLVTVENPAFIQFQQDYLEGLANQEFLAAEYARQQELYDENVASGKSYQQAKSNYLSNEARLKAFEARLKLIGFNPARVRAGAVSAAVNRYSPISGSVREVYANVGKYIGPQDVIMDISNAENLHVELTVYENDILRVQEGQRIRFALANAPDEWREATVFLVGHDVRADRSVTVHGHMKHPDEDLRPGMFVTAKIETGTQTVWAAPEEAVVRVGGKYYVFAYAGQQAANSPPAHQFEMMAVARGFTEDGYTQIDLTDTAADISSLQLVTKGAPTLLAQATNTE